MNLIRINSTLRGPVRNLLSFIFLCFITLASHGQAPPVLRTQYTTQAVAQVDARVASLASSGALTVMATNVTFFVLTNGSDSNNGLANTAGGAFKTIQKSIINASRYWVSNTVFITNQIGDGVYNENIAFLPLTGGGGVILNGNSSTPANVLLAPSAGDAIAAAGSVGGWTVQNFKVWPTNGNSIVSSQGATVVVGTGMNFGPAKAGGYHMLANNNGAIIVSGSYSVSGGTGNHYYATRGSVINDSVSPTVTITGTPAFTAFCAADDAGVVAMFNVTFSGATTGKRFDGNLNGVIHVITGSITYYPGNAAGTTNNGAQYQ